MTVGEGQRTEQASTPEGVHEASVSRVKELVREAIASGQLPDEILTMPREALIEAAWNGIANYHSAGVAGRLIGTPAAMARDKTLEIEKDFRLSLLNEQEQETAIRLANNWLDDNFAD